MGGISPMITKLFTILMMAKNITINPAVLKKIPAFELFWMLNELKLMRASTGKVPRAKESIVRPPLKKLPVESV